MLPSDLEGTSRERIKRTNSVWTISTHRRLVAQVPRRIWSVSMASQCEQAAIGMLPRKLLAHISRNLAKPKMSLRIPATR